MVKIEVFKARHNVVVSKNGTFLEGELYYGRRSKNGNKYVLRSEEGYWVSIVNYDFAKNGLLEFLAKFRYVTEFDIHNRKEMKNYYVTPLDIIDNLMY